MGKRNRKDDRDNAVNVDPPNNVGLNNASDTTKTNNNNNSNANSNLSYISETHEENNKNKPNDLKNGEKNNLKQHNSNMRRCINDNRKGNSLTIQLAQEQNRVEPNALTLIKNGTPSKSLSTVKNIFSMKLDYNKQKCINNSFSKKAFSIFLSLSRQRRN